MTAKQIVSSCQNDPFIVHASGIDQAYKSNVWKYNRSIKTRKLTLILCKAT